MSRTFTRQELRRYLSGRVTPEEFEQISAWLRKHPEQLDELDALDDRDQKLVARLRQLLPNARYADDAEFRRALSIVETLTIEGDETIGPGPSQPGSASFPSLPGYRFVRLLGQGGMGTVYEATNELLKNKVAIKVLLPSRVADASAVDRFLQEMRVVGRLNHPNLVRGLDARQVGGDCFLVMEYLEGENLEDWRRNRQPRKLHEACECIRQAALGLEHIHRQGMIHRDIKPSNLLRTPEGVIKILDLGLARIEDMEVRHGITTEGMVMGTPDYIAPEQAHSPQAMDHRADIYSLGCTFYFLLAGRGPFETDRYPLPINKVMAHLQHKPALPKSLLGKLPQPVLAILGKMLAKEPDRRFAAAQQVAIALELYCRRGNASVEMPALSSLSTAVGEAGASEQELETTDFNETTDFAEQKQLPPPARRKRKPGKQRRKTSPWIRFGIPAGAIAAVALILAGILINIQTATGVVTLEIDGNVAQPLRVDVAQDKTITLTDPNDGKPLTVTVDRSGQELALRKEGFEVVTRSFKLKLKEQTVRVTFTPSVALATPLPPTAIPSPPAEPGRKESPPVVAGNKPAPAESPQPMPAIVHPLAPTLGSWKPGPLNELLQGIALRTSPFADIVRWDVATALPAKISRAETSADGRYLACSTEWNLRAGLLYIFENPPAPNTLRRILPLRGGFFHWHPRENRLLALLPDQRLGCFAEDGKLLWSQPTRLLGQMLWSPSGDSILAWDRTHIHLLAGGNGGLVRSTPFPVSGIVSVSWTPDGQRACCLSLQGSLHVWDVQKGAFAEPWQFAQPVPQVNGRPRILSPRGRWIAWLPEQTTGPLELWDTTAKTRGRPLQDAPWFNVGEFAFSPDETKLAWFDYGGQLYLWDIRSGRLLWRREHLPDTMLAFPVLSWTPDGGTVISAEASAVDCLRSWEAKSGKLSHRMVGFGADGSAAWSQNGERLYFTGSTQGVWVWDQAKQTIEQPVQRLPIQPHALAVSPDESTLALAFQSAKENRSDGLLVKLSENARRVSLPEVQGRYTRLEFDPAGDWLALTWNEGWGAGRAAFRETSNGNYSPAFPIGYLPFLPPPLAWQRKLPFFVNEGGLLEGRNPFLQNPGRLVPLPTFSAVPDSLAIAVGSGKIAVANDQAGRLLVLDPSGMPLGPPLALPRIQSLAWHPTLDYLVVETGSEGGDLKLIDVRDQPLLTSSGCPLPHTGHQMKWSPDGTLLALHGMVRIEQGIRLISFPEMQPYASLHAFPDGSAALISAAGELASEIGTARDQLRCVAEGTDGQWRTWTYREFLDKYRAAIPKRAAAP